MSKLLNYLDRRHYNYCKREIKKLREKEELTDKEKKRIGELYCDIALYEMENDKSIKKKKGRDDNGLQTTS